MGSVPLVVEFFGYSDDVGTGDTVTTVNSLLSAVALRRFARGAVPESANVGVLEVVDALGELVVTSLVFELLNDKPEAM